MSIRPLEVLAGHFEVVLRRHQLAVAKPFTNHMIGVLSGQFRLPGAPEVLKGLNPWLSARPMDDPLQLSPEVGVRASAP